RYGRTFQPSEPTTNRPPDRPVARSAPVGSGPVVAGVGPASNGLMTSVRPVGRSLGRSSRP
ncbi:MAG: hypothetical protein QOF49_626, partial [Chloroflexota bacterium]|nr:hypothetical protein [Chloroflexota bacterium]